MKNNYSNLYILMSKEDLGDEETEHSGTITIKQEKTKKPPLYKVLLHNDDYTTMEFVILVLKSVFNLSNDSAQKIMFEVHENGIGLCGIYTYEIADAKLKKVLTMGKDEGFPLKCTIEVE